jgi:hypothetical protein
MAVDSNPNYDPGFLNSPGKGQSAANPLAPTVVESMAVVKDFSVYQNIYGNTINAQTGFTIGSNGAFTGSGFFAQPPGVFESDISFESNITVAGCIVMGGQCFKPTVINTISGPHLVLAAY